MQNVLQLWVKICFRKSGKLQKGEKTDLKTNFLPPHVFWDPGWEKIRIRDKHPGSATLARSESHWQIIIIGTLKMSTSSAQKESRLMMVRTADSERPRKDSWTRISRACPSMYTGYHNRCLRGDCLYFLANTSWRPSPQETWFFQNEKSWKEKK
jgi:hypothetical protein